jgi:hypothetical protein
VDDDHGVSGVVLAGEHVPELERVDLFFELVERMVEISDERFVLEFDGDLDLLRCVACRGPDAVVSLGPRLVVVQFLEQRVCSLLVIPEIGRCRDLFQVAYLLLSLIDVKDTPVIGPGGG